MSRSSYHTCAGTNPIFFKFKFAGNEIQRGAKLQQEHLYGVDFEGGSMLHLAVDSGVLKVKSLAPSYFLSYFTRFSNIHNYTTRNSIRLSIPRVKLN